MSNFILDFLKDKINKKQEKSNLFTEENVNFEIQKHTQKQEKEIILIEQNDLKNIEKHQLDPWFSQEIETNNTKILNDEKIQEQRKSTQNELTWYLSNNSNLDNSMIKMNEEIAKDIENELKEETEERWIKNARKNQKIEIVEHKSNKSIYWIFWQFIFGIFLIVISSIYVYWNTAEYKFMKSSIDLWTNTVNNIMTRFGGAIWDDAKQNYITKRESFVDDLTTLNNKIDECLKNKLEQKKDYLEEIQDRINSLKTQLLDVELISLDKFIKDFDQYSLWVNSLKTSVKNECE